MHARTLLQCQWEGGLLCVLDVLLLLGGSALVCSRASSGDLCAGFTLSLSLRTFVPRTEHLPAGGAKNIERLHIGCMVTEKYFYIFYSRSCANGRGTKKTRLLTG